MNNLIRRSVSSILPPENAFSRALRLGIFSLPFSPALGLSCFVFILIKGLIVYFHRYKRRSLTWAWLGMITLLIGSTIQAAFPGEALLGLANFIPFILLFIVLREFLTTPQPLLMTQRLIALTVIPLVILGGGALAGWWHGPVQWGWIIQWTLAAGGTPQGRMDSIFSYANVFASYLTLAWPFSLSLCTQSWRPNPQSWWHPIGDRWLWSISTLMTAVGLVFTHSRNGWMIAAIVWVCFAISEKWYRWLGVALGLFSSILWAAFGPIGRSLFQHWIPIFLWGRLNDQLYPHRPIADLRITQWKFAWNLTLEHPWFGWGLRNFSPLYQAKMGAWLGHPHNFFLMMAAEAGIPVLIGFLAIVTWIFAHGILRTQHIFSPTSASPGHRLLILSTFLSFAASVAFHCFDVTLFDARINVLNWLLLAALAGLPDWRDLPPEKLLPPTAETH